AARDPRIKIVFLDKNSGISTATNRAGQLATGSYLGFLDNDDELAPQALTTLVKGINRMGGELFYSDEDLIGTDGRQHSIFRKPAFNRELLYSHNYITHFVLVTRILFERVGGCNPLHDGAQDFDLFLKLSEQAETITHIPEILYHWRATPTSTSINHSEKGYANEAGRVAIEESLARRNIPATVENTGLKYYYRARRWIDNDFSATLVVYAEPDQADANVWLTELLHQTTDKTFLEEVVVVVPSAGSCPSLQTLSELYKITMRIITVEEDSPMAGYNLGSKGVTTDFIVFTSTAIKIVNGQWLTGLIEYGQAEETGMVGGRIDCTNEKLEPATHIPDISQTSETYYCRFMTNCSVLMNGRHCPQEVLAVNTELSLIKTADFVAAGRFNSSDFPYIFATLDLCYRLRRQGKINIFTPYSQAVWQSDDVPLSSAAKNDLLMKEKSKFTQTWRELLQVGDPFYNDRVVSDHGIAVTDFHKWRSA
ncbi:MAG: glycosyltransferase, partial [Desulforhopalus sp.]